MCNPEKLKYVNKELDYLEPICKNIELINHYNNNLLEINTKLWILKIK